MDTLVVGHPAAGVGNDSGTDLAAERPPMVAALSPSSIATWKQCPKRFFFEKILRLETDPGLEAVCGSFVHEVLEHLMELPAGQRQPETARRVATERWQTFRTDPSSRFVELELDDEGVKAFKQRAWAGISGYFLIEDPARVDVVAVEQQVRAELDGAPIFGIVDRLERAGEHLVVADYKTGKAPQWQEEVDEKLEQLHLYAAMLDALGTPVSTLRLLFVSPQLAAGARAQRAAQEASAALAAAAEVAGSPPIDVAKAMAALDRAHRMAREAEGDAGGGGSTGMETVALEQGIALAGPERGPVLAPLLMAAWSAARRSRFAARDAERARPREITLDVRPEHLAQARAEVARVWSEATACYEAWDFPATTGVLCGWCPFSDRCDGYASWDAAGRPRSGVPALSAGPAPLAP